MVLDRHLAHQRNAGTHRAGGRGADARPAPANAGEARHGAAYQSFPAGTGRRAADGSEASRRAFAALGNERAATFGKGGRHPLMHRTETIDYAIVLSGEITMVLDDVDVLLEAGDIVVQCGTNHAWSNRSNAPCVVAFVLIDGAFEPELAQKFA
jgi:quercetin dioxygenase-like cupin family protein